MLLQYCTPLLTLACLLPSAAAQATITVTGAAAAPTSSSLTDDSTFERTTLDAHNFYREQHNVTALRWNESLADRAEEWSEECRWEHSGGPTGENLASNYPNATQAIDGWALERTQYSWSSPGFSSATGHFTQLIWSNTTTVGCARTLCDDENMGYYIVCEYWPVGNVLGADGDTTAFRENVPEQVVGQETDTVESGTTADTSAGSGWVDLRRGDGLWGAAVVVGAAVMGIGLV